MSDTAKPTLNERIEARRSQGQQAVTNYVFGLVHTGDGTYNKEKLASLNLTPEEHAGVQVLFEQKVEQKVKEAAEYEQLKLGAEKRRAEREAAFQAQLEKMRAAGLPTEDTVDSIWWDGQFLGIEFDPDTMLKGASGDDIDGVIGDIMEATQAYFSYDTPSPAPGKLVALALNGATTREEKLEVLSAVLDAVNNWDDSYHNKRLVVVRCPDPGIYQVEDLGDNSWSETKEDVNILGGYGFGEHYRFVEEDEDDEADAAFYDEKVV